MLRIMFVDDEQHVLDSLRRLLLMRRHDWDMTFASSGAEALSLMRANAFDVIVTDMRMPVMNGAALLRIVLEEFPSCARIVLSGFSEVAAALQSVSVAHQLLQKPCSQQTLFAAVHRVSELKERLGHSEIRDLICGISALPSSPSAIAGLAGEASSPRPSVENIEDIVGGDVAMTAKVLQLANSMYFGEDHSIIDVHKAVSLLGIAVMRDLVAAGDVFYNTTSDTSSDSINALDEYSQTVSRVASDLVVDTNRQTEAGCAGMLHDVGLLALASRMPRQFSDMHQKAVSESRPLREIEVEEIGIDHAQIGAELLRFWGLPDSVVEPVAHHHDASPASAASVENIDLTVVHAVQLAVQRTTAAL